MKYFFRLLLLSLVFIVSNFLFDACSHSSEPDVSTPERNFEILWQEFDARYSFFVVKNIHWGSLYNVYRPQVTATTTDTQLFTIISALLEHLKDGHVSLSTPLGNYAYQGWHKNYPANFLGTATVERYYSKNYGTLANGYIRYARMSDSLGYIYIGPNLSGDVAVWGQAIDQILDSLANVRGIILDIRNNTGGNDALGKIILSRFTDKERIYSYVQFRNGPAHNNFTAMQAATIAPQGARQFLKPLAFLTNRRCFSSAEGTTLMARVLPHCTIIGDTTGGGSANPIQLTLPNGWQYRVSRWIQYTAEQTTFEGKGLAPHIPVWINSLDSAAGRDAILERAIRFICEAK